VLCARSVQGVVGGGGGHVGGGGGGGGGLLSLSIGYGLSVTPGVWGFDLDR